MIGALIDITLGVIVFTGVMYGFWRERQKRPVVLVINDELLGHFRRIEVAAQHMGVASREAAKSFERFARVLTESMRKERERYPLRTVTIKEKPWDA